MGQAESPLGPASPQETGWDRTASRPRLLGLALKSFDGCHFEVGLMQIRTQISFLLLPALLDVTSLDVPVQADDARFGPALDRVLALGEPRTGARSPEVDRCAPGLRQHTTTA